MDDFIVARAIHVLAVVMWIGGVGFVTTVMLPSVRRSVEAERRLLEFHRFEARFAPQAKLWVLGAGLSGLWMTWRANLWDRFSDLHYWWMHAMVAVWLAFAVMLFILEPLYLHKRLAASPDPERDFKRMGRMHAAALAVSLLTLVGVVAGSHGWAF
jgi:uncharacterized membrane protein